jgi:hypothetical protein
MKRMPEYIEGPEAWQRFNAAMKHVVSVPHAKVQEQIKEHRRQAALNPNRRGPRRKVKPSASPGPVV